MRRIPKNVLIYACLLVFSISITALFLSLNNTAGFVVGAFLLAVTCYWGYGLYRALWRYNGGYHLSKAKKRRLWQLEAQGEAFTRYTRMRGRYKVGVISEDEYQAEKAKERLKKIH